MAPSQERTGRWWARELANVDDPISLEPIRALRYPPFELRANPSAANGARDSDWYDGALFASYLVSTGTFAHPISRRELTRKECVALDAYLRENRLAAAHVAEAFDNRELYATADGAPPGSRVAALRAEADMVLHNLFAGASARRVAGARGGTRRDDAVVADGNMRFVDDDLVPSHASSGLQVSSAAPDVLASSDAMDTTGNAARPIAATAAAAAVDAPSAGRLCAAPVPAPDAPDARAQQPCRQAGMQACRQEEAARARAHRL